MLSRGRVFETVLQIRGLCFWPLSMAKLSHSFTFLGSSYRYFYHPKYETWMNHRAVEIPIVWRIVQAAAGKRILEVGNVLSNYFPCQHDILDKYDPQPGIINEDVVDFKPARPYDLIVSICTLNVVGWAEAPPQDPTKFLRAVRNLERCLAPGGMLVATLPLAYHPEIDALSKSGRLPFTNTHYLERVSLSNRWRETTQPVVARFRVPLHPKPKFRTVAIGVTVADASAPAGGTVGMAASGEVSS